MLDLFFASILLLAMVGLAGCYRSDRGKAPTVKTNPEAVTSAASSTQPVDPRVEAFFGGSQVMEIISQPEEAQAFRLDDFQHPVGAPSPGDGDHLIDGYKMIAGPVVVAGKNRRDLISDLEDPHSYMFNGASQCVPHWDVAYRFSKANHVVDVVICLHCGIIQKFYDGKEMQGTLAGYVSGEALIMARRLFPEDRKLGEI